MIDPKNFAMARECTIRDAYARRLEAFRPDEFLLGTEVRCEGVLLRADMRTVDCHNIIRIWEFKKIAGYEALGQVLTYLALDRMKENFRRDVRGVLAAFEFVDNIFETNAALNLGIEFVHLPLWLTGGGYVPQMPAAPVQAVEIPIV